ncbi:MAG: secretin N-terminal domain-containing protein [Candidatus Symbiodolus clandestinus]
MKCWQWAGIAGGLLGSLIAYPMPSEIALPISVTLQQVPITLALQTLADYQQLNLVVSAPLSGTVSLRLQNVPWQQALEGIMQAHGLQYSLSNNLLIITQKASTTAEASASSSPVERQAELTTAYIKVRHAKAVDLAALLKNSGPNRLLSPQGGVYVDQRTNQLLVRDTLDQIAVIKQLISRFDQAAAQVQIEARIVTMSQDDLNKLGVQWRLINPTVANAAPHLAMQLPTAEATTQATLQVATLNGRLLDLELSALAQENKVEIIATPKLFTLDRQLASIKQGLEIPYAVAKAKGATAIEFREAVLGLEATPTIIDQHNIILKLNIRQNTPGKSVKVAQGEAIAIDKQEIRTQVRLADGETVVLGGIFQRFNQVTRERVPLLGEIPLLGWLFQRRTQQTTKRELVIFVTPRLLPHQSTVTSLSLSS